MILISIHTNNGSIYQVINKPLIEGLPNYFSELIVIKMM